MRFAKLQRWMRSIADGAGIGYTVGGLLSNVELDDSEGMRFAKLQRWLKVISDGISGGGSIPVYVTPPATSTSPGTAGNMAYDGSYLYLCVASATWRRVAIDDWA